MTQNKHTPGPWVIDPDETTMAGPGVYADGFGYVAVGAGSSYADRAAEERANVSLIAAAPDLLEALEVASGAMACALQTYVCADHGLDPCSDREKLQRAATIAGTALAKARGETS